MANTRDDYKDQCGGTMMHATDPEEGIAGMKSNRTRARSRTLMLCVPLSFYAYHSTH